jgi:hypothetical protein
MLQSAWRAYGSYLEIATNRRRSSSYFLEGVTAMQQSVLCTVPTRAAADLLVRKLEQSIFPRSEISVICSDPSANGAVLSTTNDIKGASDDNRSSPRDTATNEAVDAVSAVTAGSVMGGFFGLFVGTLAFLLPGFGPLIVAGPVIGLLGGAAAGAGVGTLANVFAETAVAPSDAARFEKRVREGYVLISVHVKSYAEQLRATDVCERNGAEDIYLSHDEIGMAEANAFGVALS